MCGIYGSNNREKFLTLHKLNLQRGDFAHSSLLIDKEGFDIYKVPLQTSPKVNFKFPKKKKYDLYLGHVQAPTSSQRIFTANTSHPFIVENWVVAHNGVLTNFKQLVNQFEMPYNNPVDSSIIPYMLYSSQNMLGKHSEVDLIINCLNLLKGTFGLWIFNANTNNSFLAKCGVTLFGDIYENTFSSIHEKGLSSLEEGVLYQLTSEGITSVGVFDCDSPFFTV
jgi:glucosamine 6-phosphate synthetase-like amidotransferase/phosphosugar isomerase protein